MKPILIIDYQGKNRYGSVNLDYWIDSNIVEFYEGIDNIDRFDQSMYETAFVHTSNQEANWAKQTFNPVFLFSGGKVQAPTQKRHMLFMSRQFFLERLPRVLEQYYNSGQINSDTFISQDENQDFQGPAVFRSSKTKSAITFTKDENCTDSNFVFPVLESHLRDNADIDFVATLRPLSEIKEPTPIFLHETYLTPRDGLELLLRIRLGAGIGGIFSRFPIYVQLQSSLDQLLRQYDIKFAVLCTRGVHIVEKFPAADDVPVDMLLPHELNAVLDQLPIRPDPNIDHHDLSNEWGVLRLWRGHQLSQEEEVEVPQELVRHRDSLLQREYYAYLAARSALNHGDVSDISEDSPELNSWRHFLALHIRRSNRPLRILLIDDEADKGWGHVLPIVLNSESPESIDLSVYPHGQMYSQKKARKEALENNWDIILCDLRLRLWDDRAITADSDPAKRATYSGIDLIRDIKQAKPNVPVVVFTASQTVWTTRSAEDVGADGYWVKESPERPADDKYSKRNIDELYSLIHRCVKKSQDHSFLWSLIDDVKDARHSDEYLRIFQPLDNYNRIKDRLSSIEHLLRRAYGLLMEEPTPFRQKQYNYESKHLSDLAFLHIWGCTNEVLAIRIKNVEDRDCRMIRSNRECDIYWSAQGERPGAASWIASEMDEISKTNRIRPSASRSKRGSDTTYISLLLKEAKRSELDHSFGRCKDVRNMIDVVHGHVGTNRERVNISDHLEPLVNIVRATLLLDN